jgi:hypothetical protein
MLWVKEPLNKSSAERVADKIGLITRRTTQVVAWSTMPRGATQWRPKASPEGPREAGSTRVGDALTALIDDWAMHPASGSHSLRRLSRIPSRKAAVALAWDLFRGSLILA